MAGLGKTALAREAAGRLAETDRFADIAWVTVRPVSYTLRSPREDLSAASGLSGNDLALAIEALIIHSLLQAIGFEEKTYSLHPLTYHFASSQAAQQT